MPSKRHINLLFDRSTKLTRRRRSRLKLLLVGVSCVLVLPMMIGVGLSWRAQGELNHLRKRAAALDVENASFRAATGELTAQIASLQNALSELGVRAAVEPATARALEKLPAVLKARAVGVGASAPSVSAPGLVSPEDTFGILRGLLFAIEDRLNLERYRVERHEALVAATPSIWPAHGWLTGLFGRRTDPFSGEPEFHAGIDISTDKGRPIFATAAGTVITASYNGTYGNLVEIEHGFGLLTRYGHLSAFKVKKGDHVSRGDVLGLVGSTGRATGAHLHYEVLANGKLLNPLRLLVDRPSTRSASSGSTVSLVEPSTH